MLLACRFADCRLFVFQSLSKEESRKRWFGLNIDSEGNSAKYQIFDSWQCPLPQRMYCCMSWWSIGIGTNRNSSEVTGLIFNNISCCRLHFPFFLFESEGYQKIENEGLNYSWKREKWTILKVILRSEKVKLKCNK